MATPGPWTWGGNDRGTSKRCRAPGKPWTTRAGKRSEGRFKDRQTSYTAPHFITFNDPTGKQNEVHGPRTGTHLPSDHWVFSFKRTSRHSIPTRICGERTKTTASVLNSPPKYGLARPCKINSGKRERTARGTKLPRKAAAAFLRFGARPADAHWKAMIPSTKQKIWHPRP